MIHSLVLLSIGTVLLWMPRGWLRRGRPEAATRRTSGRRRIGPRRERPPDDQSLWLAEEFAKRRNWIDLGRAAAGAWAVSLAMDGLVPGSWSTEVGTPAQWGTGVVCAIGVLLQTVRWEGRLALFPPVFYLFGFAFLLLGWKAAVFAFIAIWVLNLVMPGPGAFLFVYAGLAVVLGLLLGAAGFEAGTLAVLALLPPLLAVLTKRRLAQFSKKTKVIVR